MSKFSQVKFWYDSGYTDGSAEIPPVGHVLPSPDIVIDEDLCPSKSRMFTELKIAREFTDLLNCSYMELTLEMNNGIQTQTYYGWIDDVIIQSDTDGSPETIIRWHVDPWRTFNQRTSYGSGFVVRKPSDGNDFYQNYQYVSKTKSSDYGQPLVIKSYHVGDEDITVPWWVLLAVQEQDDGKVTRLKFITFPLLNDWFRGCYIHADAGTARAIRFNEVMFCTQDEKLGINPETITGAWLCPISPIRDADLTVTLDGNRLVFTYTPTSLDSSWEAKITDEEFPQDRIAWFESRYLVDPIASDRTFNHVEHYMDDVPRKALEGKEYIITGPTGEIIGTVPFGKSLPDIIITDLVASATAAYLRIELGQVSEGMVYNYPLPSIDVNSNSWSSYVYSGQREYDIIQRSTNSMRHMVEGATSSGVIGGLIGLGTKNNAIAGGQSARMHKSMVALGGEALTGGVRGLVAGSLIGAAGSIITGALELGVFNDQFQDSEDRYHAMQADTVLMSGDAFFLFYHTQGMIHLDYLRYDDMSNTAIEDMKTVQGVQYNAPVPDCTDLINAGGPLQIINLIVRGAIPTTVKKWIKQKFADGVRIVARS